MQFVEQYAIFVLIFICAIWYRCLYLSPAVIPLGHDFPLPSFFQPSSTQSRDRIYVSSTSLLDILTGMQRALFAFPPLFLYGAICCLCFRF